jgi:hypothetical protein
MSIIGSTIEWIFRVFFVSVGIGGAIIVLLTFFAAWDSGDPLTVGHLAVAVGVGWTIPYMNMIVFFRVFNRKHRFEYLYKTAGEGFASYFWYSNGPIKMHTLVSRISKSATRQYSSGLVSYARISWLLNWVWVLLFLVFVTGHFFDLWKQ